MLKPVCACPRGPDHDTKAVRAGSSSSPDCPCPRRSGHPLTVVLHPFSASLATAPAASHRLTACRTLQTSLPSPDVEVTSFVSAGSWRARVEPWAALHRGVGAPWPQTVRVARAGRGAGLGGTRLVVKRTASVVVRSLSNFIVETGSHIELVMSRMVLNS